MSQQDNFSTGFLLGAVVGGVVGGVLGSILVKRLPTDEVMVEKSDRLPEVKPAKRPLRSPPVNQEERELANSETARRSLEDKIAQLNDAIDDVRDQLKRVGGSSSKEGLPLSNLGNDTIGLELMPENPKVGNP
jgi:hypothetical protein